VRDVARQIANAVAVVSQVVMTALAGTALFGGESVGEISARYPTYVQPADYAFVVWAPIFALAFVYAAYGASPARRTDPLLRRIGWWTALAYGSNSLWILAFQTQRFLLAGTVIFLTLICLAVAFVRTFRTERPLTGAERRRVEIPIGVFFGWITAANVANAAQVIAATGWEPWGLTEVQWSIALLLMGTVFSCLVILNTRGSLPYSLTILWALAAVVVNQLSAPAPVLATASASLAAVLLALAVSSRQRGRTDLGRPKGSPA